MCWMEIEHFRSMSICETKLRDTKARQIRKQFFNKSYFFGPQSPANKEQQLQVHACIFVVCVRACVRACVCVCLHTCTCVR